MPAICIKAKQCWFEKSQAEIGVLFLVIKKIAEPNGNNGKSHKYWITIWNAYQTHLRQTQRWIIDEVNIGTVDICRFVNIDTENFIIYIA